MSTFVSSVGSICRLELLDRFGSIRIAARELGMPYQTMLRKLKGGRITVVDLSRFAVALETTVGSLMNEAEEFQRGNQHSRWPDAPGFVK